MAHTKNLMVLWVALIVLVGVILVIPLFTGNFLGGKALAGRAFDTVITSGLGGQCGDNFQDRITYECESGLLCINNICDRFNLGGVKPLLEVFNNPISDPAAQSCIHNTLSGSGFLYCNQGEYVECGVDVDEGTVTPNGDYWCDGNIWSSNFPMGENDFYEVEISKQGNDKTIVGSNYVSLDFCSDDLQLEFQASLCYGNTRLPPIYSVAHMYQENLQPVVEELTNDGDVLFLYEDESVEGKNISLVLNWDLNSLVGRQLNLEKFVENLQQGQRLSLTLDGEVYVVWKDQNINNFFAGLRARHLPNGELFELQDLPENKYQFAVLADKAIVFDINLDGRSFTISAEKPAEALAVSPSVASLAANFEIPFTRDAPAQLQDLGATITPCADDSAAEVDVMRVCLNNNEITTLNRAELTNYIHQGKTISLLYLFENGQKKGYVFWNQQVNKLESEVDHTRFVENMALGRRLAVTFAGNTYLLSHPVSDFSLTNLELKRYAGVNEAGQETITSQTRSGSWKAIEFNLNEGGKIYLKREEATPPPPFKISGKTTLELTTELFNLQDNLFTTVSTTNPVNLENYGLLKISDNDVNLDASFILKVDNEGTTLPSQFIDNELNLNLGVPNADLLNHVLFYYTEAQELGTEVEKTAEIYYLYDISSAAQNRPFTNDFIQTLTGGKELALKYGDAYYVLWYQGATSGTGLFKLNELRLRSLDGSYQAPANVNNADLSVTFITPSGDVLVKITTGPPASISFSKRQVSLDTSGFNNEMSLLLSAEVQSVINNNVYYIADSESGKLIQNSVRIFAGSSYQQLIVDQPQIINNLFFWYEGVVDNKKVVSVHIYLPLTADGQAFIAGKDWAQFTVKMAEGKSIVYHWADQDFVLSSTNLQQITPVNLVLKTVPEGMTYPVANYKLSPDGLYNITFAYKSNLLELRQTWDSDFANVLVNLHSLTEKLITVGGLNFTEGGAFRSKVEGGNYLLKVKESELDPTQVETPLLYNLPLNLISLEQNGEMVASFYLPEKQTKQLLLPDGDVINIKLINATSHEVTLTK